MDSPEVLAGGGIVALVLTALTAFFKWGLPALRNGKHHYLDSNDLASHLGRLREHVDADNRKALETAIATIDLLARERFIDHREAEQRKHSA